MTAFDLDDFLPYRLAVLASRVSTAFSKRYGRRFGLSIPEWRVIAHLSQADAVSVREIHERVDMDKSKVSRAAARLETAGIVSKQASATDKRLVSLSLTDKGRQIMAEIGPMARAYEAEIRAKLSRDDRAALDRILGVLLENNG